MKRQITRNSTLRDLVRLLREADAPDKAPEKMPDDSIDNQVDKFLMEYEQSSRAPKTESFNLRSATRMLLEAEGDPKPAAGEDPGSDDKSDKSDVGDTKLDVSEFSSSVMRLITNYDSLIEVRDTLVKRAYNFLLEKHDAATAKEFTDTMRRDYDVEVGKSEYDKEAEISAPPAQRSGGSGGGGGG